MLDSDVPTATPEDAADTTPAPRRRRRAASRPAGPPKELPPRVAPAAIAPPSAEPESVEAEWSELAAAQEQAAEPAVAEPAASEHVEAGFLAQEPGDAVAGDVEQVGEPVAEADVEAVDEAASEEPTVDEPTVDEPTIDEPTVDAAASEERVDDEPASDEPASDEGVADEAVAERPAPERPARRRGTRRRKPEPKDDGDATDLVAAGLAALSAERGSPGQDPDDEDRPADVSAALDDLAAVLAGADADEDSDADDYGEGEGEGDEDADDGTSDSDDAPRKRRRRRGGRRRRKSSDDDSADEPDADDDADDQPNDDAPAEAASGNEGEDNGDAVPAGRRRRRRRRKGEDTGSDAEEGVDVVVKVREPRGGRGKSPNDEITSIEGSTRMEAKRQRRREGRAAGRRRAPILSESEFLARRESVERQMLIRQADDYTQIAVLEDGVLVEHYVDRATSASLIGNVYLGRVQNVLPSMEAAFVDIGRGRNAVIYAGEIDWDSFGVSGDDRKVEKVLKSGQAVLVQVTKDPIGAKGARLTAHISLPGRYVVYCPGGQLSGISRKLPDGERARLKGILDEVVGSDASVIVRTAAEGASEDELVRDVSRLQAQWQVIEKKVKAGSAPQQLYAEPDLTVRIVRDLFTEDFSALVVEGNDQAEDVWDTMEGYVTHVAPHLAERLRRWDRATEGDLFTAFRVHEQVAKALERRVHLPSGGSLIIDRTEAMTVVDVNTGKFTGTQGNLEATVTSNNLEAAEEIVRQLRLRDIGGIIIIDFIDMVLPANRELLLRRLVECLGRDRTRHQVAEVTSLGLVQMTRKRIGTGLAEAFTVSCETCNGRGYHVHDAPVASQAPADGGDRDPNGRRGARARGGRSRGGQDAAPAPAPRAKELLASPSVASIAASPSADGEAGSERASESGQPG
ncbi:MAG: Rne/Rng family ribonuclease [Nigerium sp.]|nr:Rne/Rng family ribonuclease [Nigerium sp.]